MENVIAFADYPTQIRRPAPVYEMISRHFACSLLGAGEPSNVAARSNSMAARFATT